MKSICLVIVSGGVARTAQPTHVQCEIIDLDNIAHGDALPELPRGIGFEELTDAEDLIVGRDFEWSPS